MANPISTDLTVGTRAVVVVTASGNQFAKKVNYLKLLGGQFDSVGKVWVVNITTGNADAAQSLASVDGRFTGYKLLSRDEWVQRRENGVRPAVETPTP